MSHFENKYNVELKSIQKLQHRADCLVRQFFENSSYDTASLMKQLRMVHAVSSMLQRTLNREIEFDTIKDNEADAELRDLQMTLKDTTGLFERVLEDVQSATGKKIVFKSDLKK